MYYDAINTISHVVMYYDAVNKTRFSYKLKPKCTRLLAYYGNVEIPDD